MVNENNLIKYCLQHMCTKEFILSLLNKHSIKHKPSDSYAKLSERFFNDSNPYEDLGTLRDLMRNIWKPCPKELHLKNLKSELLLGHDWHGAMPSMLHLSMQNKVRDHIEGKMDLDELIAIGGDIMKHEYFMVATHDLCETKIIEGFPTVIPSVGKKSITDFIFNDVPYDLKMTNYFKSLTKADIINNKKEVAVQLLNGADIQRLREQAKKTYENWGLNRFYVLVEEQDRWISEPELVLDELVAEASRLAEPDLVKIDGMEINVQLIAL